MMGYEDGDGLIIPHFLHTKTVYSVFEAILGGLG